jgi:hypothetical protein
MKRAATFFCVILDTKSLRKTSVEPRAGARTTISLSTLLRGATKFDESDCPPGLEVADEELSFSCCFLYTKNLDSVS